MQLNDFQTRTMLQRFALPLVRAVVAHSADEADAAAREIGLPVILSIQPTANVRLKRHALTLAEVHEHTLDLLRLKVNGAQAKRVLIEAEIVAQIECSLAIYADTDSHRPVIIAQCAGSSASETINPLSGVFEFQARNLVNTINLPREYWREFIALIQQLYTCAVQLDALRLELHAIALLPNGSLLVRSADLQIDDYALFRHPELELVDDVHDGVKRHARAAGITYTPLRGTVACVVNGAGLGMATIDMLMVAGLRAACILDLCTDLSSGKMAAALNILLHHQVRAVCFNLFATRTSAEMVAHDLAAMLNEFALTIPVIVRIEGQEVEAARAVINQQTAVNVISVTSMSQAVMRLISLLRQGSGRVNSG